MAGGRVIGGNPMMDSFKVMNQSLSEALKMLQNQKQLQEMQREFDREDKRLQGQTLWKAAAPTPEQMVMNAQDKNPVLKESLKLMHGWDDETASRYMDGIASFNLLPDQQGQVAASQAYSLLQSGKPEAMQELSGLFGDVWNQQTVGLDYPNIVDRSGQIRGMAPTGGARSGEYTGQMQQGQGQTAGNVPQGSQASQQQQQTMSLAPAQASKEQELQALERVQAQGKSTPEIDARASQIKQELGQGSQTQQIIPNNRTSAYQYYQQMQNQSTQEKLSPETQAKIQAIDEKLKNLAPDDPERKYLLQEKALLQQPGQSKATGNFFLQIGENMNNLRGQIAYSPEFDSLMQKQVQSAVEAEKLGAEYSSPEAVEKKAIINLLGKSPAKGKALGFGSVQEVKQAIVDGTIEDKISANRDKARKALAATSDGAVVDFVDKASKGESLSPETVRKANIAVDKAIRDAEREKNLVQTFKELKKVDPTLLAMYFPDAAKRSDIEFQKDVTGKNLLLQEAQLKINDKIANTEQARLYLQAAAQAAQDAVVQEHPEYKFMFDLSEKAMLDMLKKVDITDKNAWKHVEENLKKGPASIAWTLYQKTAEQMGIDLKTVKGRRNWFEAITFQKKPEYTTTEFLSPSDNKAYAPVTGVSSGFNADAALQSLEQ